MDSDDYPRKRGWRGDCTCRSMGWPRIWTRDEGARFVEEPETDVPDGAETPQHLLVCFGDCAATVLVDGAA